MKNYIYIGILLLIPLIVFSASESIEVNESGHHLFNDIVLQTHTPGAVLHIGSDGRIDQDETILFWDDTNNRLGIGTSTPENTLHVSGGHIQLDNTQRLVFENAAGTGDANIRLDVSDVLSFTAEGSSGFEFEDSSFNTIASINGDAPDNSFVVDASGSVGIGTTSPPVTLTVEENVSGGIIRASDGTNICDFDPEPGQASLPCLSDARLKDNITNAPNQLDYLLNIPVKQFTLKGEEETHIGVIAQELQETHPELVDDSEEYLKVAPPSTWVLIKAIQELHAENQELQERIEVLEEYN